MYNVKKGIDWDGMTDWTLLETANMTSQGKDSINTKSRMKVNTQYKDPVHGP